MVTSIDMTVYLFGSLTDSLSPATRAFRIVVHWKSVMTKQWLTNHQRCFVTSPILCSAFQMRRFQIIDKFSSQEGAIMFPFGFAFWLLKTLLFQQNHVRFSPDEVRWKCSSHLCIRYYIKVTFHVSFQVLLITNSFHICWDRYSLNGGACFWKLSGCYFDIHTSPC